jgi:TolB protein
MRTHFAHRRAAGAAALIASAALLAACGPQAGSPFATAPLPSAEASPSVTGSPSTMDSSTGADSPTPSPTATGERKPTSRPTKGATLISNGTRTVLIAGQAVIFPTTVEDAVWIPNGRIAFVDGDGNISTANWDGTGRKVLTKAKDGVRRSNLAYFDGQILWESRSDGTRTIWGVYEENPFATRRVYLGANGPETAVGDPTASELGPLNAAFQHSGTAAQEIWVVDNNAREPMAAKVATGTSPALAPSGDKIAFIGPDGDIRVVRDVAGKPVYGPGAFTAPVRVTFGAHATGDLAWTADGKTIAYSTATGIDEVSGSTTADASHTVTHVSSTPGSIDFRVY